MESVGLYIHIPYCESKCTYCDFASFTGKTDTIDVYIDACMKELSSYGHLFVDTVYFGGGTPSVLRSGDMMRLMEGIRERVELAEGAEISSEANPNSLTEEKISEFREAGINRISMGLQETDPKLLRILGRIHDASDFERAVHNCVKYGITNISGDLMYSLPTQTVGNCRKAAEFISSLPVTHVSAYALRLEEGTPLYGAEQPDEDTDREMFSVIEGILKERGFQRYEISNFALPGYECRHNLKYWEMDDYVGIGVSAHSCYRGIRHGNAATIPSYLSMMEKSGNAVISEEKVDWLEEYVMLSTRTMKGLSLKKACLREDDPVIKRMIREGLASIEEERLILTDRGMDIQNSIVLMLLERSGK